MKKLFLVLLLGFVAFPCLWAEEEFVYDTVVTETRFTHGTGLRFGYENINVTYTEWVSYSTGPWGYSGRSQERTKGVTFTYPGFAYQAEWQYFMLDVSMGLPSHSADNGRTDIGGTIRPMARCAVVDNEKLRYTVLLGPEFMISRSMGMSINLVQEIGTKVTERFMPFLGLSVGFDFSHGDYNYERLLSYQNLNYGNMDVHSGLQFQFTLGLKTMVLEDIFYYNNREVHRRRR
ncbi:MAG: hypothetical protein LBU21_07840 [Treponema sp.]|jgi:hypothetical protein|nr:hypothetical protein [Treponema sp.]